MKRQEIIDYFSNSHAFSLHSFRALCNAFKALCIEVAVDAWKKQNKGRFNVCDLGCGKGGDICKWMQYRPKIFIGIDGSSISINEAKRRHSNLLSSGQCCMKTVFVCQDICDISTSLEIENDTIDIVSSNFFLHFACESKTVFVKVLSEIYRICRPGGIFLAIIPDGDRAMSLLKNKTFPTINYGHFKIRLCEMFEDNKSPYGYSYDFALDNSFCTEYVVLPALLEMHLKKQGFETIFEKSYSSPAQAFFYEHLSSHKNVLSQILKDRSLSEIDWLSLSFFRVFLARKPFQSSI